MCFIIQQSDGMGVSRFYRVGMAFDLPSHGLAFCAVLINTGERGKVLTETSL